MQSNKHIELLGKKAKDAVTGFSGVITTVSFDLYGCVQAVITPPVCKEGKTQEGNWFDVTRLVVNDEQPVMNKPDFYKGYIAEGNKGCSHKSIPR